MDGRIRRRGAVGDRDRAWWQVGAGSANRLEMRFFPIEARATNNGHTVQYGGGDGKAGYVIFEDKIFRVLHFNFHVGSEHTVDGKQFAMEMHTVTSNGDKTLVLALLFDDGPASSGAESLGLQLFGPCLSTCPKCRSRKPRLVGHNYTGHNNIGHDCMGHIYIGHIYIGHNAGLESLDWSAIPQYPGITKKSSLGPFSLSAVYPDTTDYYQYAGSFTTPPCTEGVRWVVLRTPTTISKAQVQVFPNAGNFRPPQPLNNRPLMMNSQSAAPPAVAAHDWGYTDRGAFGWSKAFGDCGGEQQSPIDIVTAKVSQHSANRLRTDLYDFEPRATNDGHTVRWSAEDAGMIVFEGSSYRVLHFEFHRGSEHTIDGRQFAMEMHVVAQKEPGVLLVLALLFDGESGRANDALLRLGWSSLPTSKGSTLSTSSSPFNIAHFWTTIAFDMDYFQYTGSLTTPPCTEGVRWVVLSTPAPISNAQLNVFPWCRVQVGEAPITTYDTCGNFRPPQSLFSRVVHRLSPAAAGADSHDGDHTGDSSAHLSWSYLDANGPDVWPLMFVGCAGNQQSPVSVFSESGATHNVVDVEGAVNRLEVHFNDFAPTATNDRHMLAIPLATPHARHTSCSPCRMLALPHAPDAACLPCRMLPMPHAPDAACSPCRMLPMPHAPHAACLSASSRCTSTTLFPPQRTRATRFCGAATSVATAAGTLFSKAQRTVSRTSSSTSTPSTAPTCTSRRKGRAGGQCPRRWRCIW